MARFNVSHAVVVRMRSEFLLLGEVVEGAVGHGQHVVEPARLDTPGSSIELTTSGEVGLRFRYNDEDQLAHWQALELVGQTIVLRGDRDAGSGARD